MRKPLRVLIVEDSELDAKLLLAELHRSDYDVSCERVQTAAAMRAALARTRWDIVLSDYQLPTFSAPEALGLVQSLGYDLPFIIISGTVDEETAIASLKAGAHDFLSKDRLARLGPAIERELRDVVARRDRLRLEEELRQAQKMEAIGQLAGGVAHDFNNMLTAILGYAELLTEQIGPDKPIGRDLREIQAAAERAAALTRQLLAFSRKQVLTMASVDLTAVVRTLEPMLRRVLGERITITTALADEIGPVLADRSQLEHLLVNLSVNARDAMPAGGVITISTGNADIDKAFASTHPGAAAGSYAMVSVADTGTGMEPEVQARIFEPFFTTKERGHGTGLGLAAVYGTVRQLGGYVGVESTLGVGSTFTIYLPRTDQAVTGPAPETPEGPPVGTETILLVEDEPGVRRFASIALRRFGYRVVEAESAENALELLAREATPIDLLLTDIVLPKMDGRELASRLVRNHSNLRVLLMSGYSENWGTSKTPLDDGVLLLEKPFSAQALLSKIRQALGPSGPFRTTST